MSLSNQTSILSERLKTQHFCSGQKLPLQTDFLWSIVSGVVKSYTISESGALITLGFWGTDDLVGKSLSKIEPYISQCISNVEAIAIPQSQWGLVSQNIWHQARQIQQLTFIVRNNRIAKRLWLLLEWLAFKFGREIESGKLIDFKLTHQELAEAIGTTRISVTKTLNQFEREGLILRPKSKCIILKTHSLKNQLFL